MESIKMLRWEYLAIMLAVNTATFMLRTARWKVILSKIKVIRFPDLFKYLMSGFFLNNTLPMRAGEFYRAYILGTNYRFSRSACLASIVVERAADGVIFLLVTAIAVNIFSMPKYVTSGIYIMIASLVFILLMLLSSVKLKRFYTGLVRILPVKASYKNKLECFLNNFIGGLEVLWSVKNILLLLGITLLVWLAELFCVFLLTKAFGLELAFYKMTVVSAMIGLGVMIPLAPGYVGTFEFAGRTALEFLGIESATAVAFVVVLHAFQIAYIALVGIPSLFATQFKWSILKQEEKLKACAD